MGESYITIVSDAMGAENLKLELDASIPSMDNIELQVERNREIATTVLVAVVGAASAAIGALIAGLFKVAAAKGAQRIILHGRSGRKIEVPADTPTEKISDLIESARELDVDRVVIETRAQ